MQRWCGRTNAGAVTGCGAAPASRQHVASNCPAGKRLGVAKALNLEPLAATYRGNLSEAVMTHWHDTMIDRPETDGAVYVTG